MSPCYSMSGAVRLRYFAYLLDNTSSAITLTLHHLGERGRLENPGTGTFPRHRVRNSSPCELSRFDAEGVRVAERPRNECSRNGVGDVLPRDRGGRLRTPPPQQWRVGMDRRQVIVQRVREIFGERLDDVLHMVRQDRQDMRGWQEPAHVRGGAASGRPRGSVSRLRGRTGFGHVLWPRRNSSMRPASRTGANSARPWAACSKRARPAWKRSSAAPAI